MRTKTVYVNEFTGEEYDHAGECEAWEEYERNRRARMASDLDRPRPPQLRLGELIGRLKERPADEKVYFDFGGFSPTAPDSYRGFYNQLAIGFRASKYAETPTVKVVLGWLTAAVGQPFTGYKGGEYVMTEQTPVWVANYGESGHTAVVGVDGNEYQTVILTGYEPV